MFHIWDNQIVFDLNEMAIFVKVVEAGSFIGAARMLDLPKTTISRKVAQLEAKLGAKLLHRTTRRLNLTAVGEIYCDRCKQILEDIEEANLEVANLQSIPHGTLRIASSIMFGNAILSDWLIEFLNCYDRVKIEILLESRYIDLVTERIDIAFRADFQGDSTLVSQKLAAIPFVVCASPDYLQKFGIPESPQELKQHRCIVLGSSPGKEKWLFTEDNEAILAGYLKANNLMLAKQIVLAGLGIAYLPNVLIAEELKNAKLVPILTHYIPVKREMYVVYPKTRHLSAKVKTFLDFVTHKARELQTN